MQNNLVLAAEKGGIDLKEFKRLIRLETDKREKIKALCKAADKRHKEFVEALIVMTAVLVLMHEMSLIGLLL
ncbi:MAG: hypothetical protein HRK26_03455 [Rickettsiaceae bacterium H1]|nr:hypothetical protein [Rickettsiaceae bacterium H1]